MHWKDLKSGLTSAESLWGVTKLVRFPCVCDDNCKNDWGILYMLSP